MHKLPPPRPDFANLRRVLLRKGEPSRLPFIELLADHEAKEAFLAETMPVPAPGTPAHTRDQRARYVNFDIRFWYEAGYDYIPVFLDGVLPRKRLVAGDTAGSTRTERQWGDEHAGAIMSWEDFDRFSWPKPEHIDYFNVEWACTHLPDGMQVIPCGPDGQFEMMTMLMGFTPLALALTDAPDLVAAVAQKVGDLQASFYATMADMPNVGAFWMGDDLGFKTSTMVAPRHLRAYVFPHLKRIAEIAHAHDKPFLLHSCGQLAKVMDELIDDVGIDAKHSFEDVITPVAEAKQRWGDRIAILGGVDMDYLCRHTEDEVRAYTRRVIDACAPGGGFALGTGNSVANYVPIRNYVAMLQEGALFR